MEEWGRGKERGVSRGKEAGGRRQGEEAGGRLDEGEGRGVGEEGRWSVILLPKLSSLSLFTLTL